LPGDTLLAVNGATVEDVEALRTQLRSYQAGQSVRLSLLRGGVPQEIEIALGVEP
jgi:S1-C subfamily serine protease